MALVKSTLPGINPPEKTRIQVADTILPDADVSATAEQLLGFLMTMTPTVNRTIILPSAADIALAMPNANPGDGVQFQVRNFGALGVTITIVPNGSLSGQAVVSGGSYKTFLIRIGAAATYTLNDIGTSGGGTGAADVAGPGVSTDEAVVRWDGTTGELIQNSGVILDDADNMTGVVNLTTTGNLTAPGVITLGAAPLTYPAADGVLGQFMQTDGAGNLSFATIAGGGDVIGPAGATDDALVRFDGVTGTLVKNSVGLLTNAGALSGLTGLVSSGLTYPVADGGVGDVMTTNGAGTLSFSTVSGDVVGPAGATDNAVVVFDGVTGKLVSETGASPILSFSDANLNNVVGSNTVVPPVGSVSNTGLGNTVLAALTTGDNNTAVGTAALTALTTGTSNTAVGAGALDTATTASSNTAVGIGVLGSIILATSAENIGIGRSALFSAIDPSFNNIGIGNLSLGAAGAKTDNVAIGHNAGTGVTSGNDNVLLGSLVAPTLTTGSENTLVGASADVGAATSSNTIGIGAGINGAFAPTSNQIILDTDPAHLNTQQLFLRALTTSAGPFGTGILRYNSATGEIQEVTGGAGTGDVTGPASSTANAIAVFSGVTGKVISETGPGPILSFSDASLNNILGTATVAPNPALSFNNVGLGRGVMRIMTTGDDNVAVGTNAMQHNTTITSSVAIGTEAMRGLSAVFPGRGNNCVAIGHNALLIPNVTSNVVAIGSNVLQGVTGDRNTVVGAGAMSTSTDTSDDNTVMGFNALSGAVGAISDNVVIGSGTCPAVVGLGANNNVIIGTSAAPTLTTGPLNVLIGASADVAYGALTRTIGIGAGITGANRPSVTGDIVLNTGASPQRFFIPALNTVGPAGTAPLYDPVTEEFFDNTSSRRFKENIVELRDTSAIVDGLRAVEFDYKQSTVHSIGLIAEDVQELIPDIVPLDKEGRPHSVRYDLITVLLLQEVQKLKARIVALEETL